MQRLGTLVIGELKTYIVTGCHRLLLNHVIAEVQLLVWFCFSCFGRSGHVADTQNAGLSLKMYQLPASLLLCRLWCEHTHSKCRCRVAKLNDISFFLFSFFFNITDNWKQKKSWHYFWKHPSCTAFFHKCLQLVHSSVYTKLDSQLLPKSRRPTSIWAQGADQMKTHTRSGPCSTWLLIMHRHWTSCIMQHVKAL